MDQQFSGRPADSLSDLVDDQDIKKRNSISMISLLPGELLEWIFSYLPMENIFRASSVCMRWHKIITSDRFLLNLPNAVSRKPWYFMFTPSNEPSAYAYDPSLQKWYNIDLPHTQRSNWFVASSYGLICFMDKDPRYGVYVCNPITRRWRKLLQPPRLFSSNHTALAISVERPSQSHYYVSIVNAKPIRMNFHEWDVSVHLYDSRTMNWATRDGDVLTGWRVREESVICNETLYFLVQSTREGSGGNRYGLLSYNIASSWPVVSSGGTLMSSLILVPFRTSCGRLMNLNDKVVIVAGLCGVDGPCGIRGISIWVLKGKDWEEIRRMPHRYFEGLGDHIDEFASNGLEELVYVQSYRSLALVMFDMKKKRWEYAKNCSMMRRSPLHLFYGFCFEPRLEIAP